MGLSAHTVKTVTHEDHGVGGGRHRHVVQADGSLGKAIPLEGPVSLLPEWAQASTHTPLPNRPRAN